MDYEPIKKLAEQGFVFAPTAMGKTYSNRTGWPDMASNDLPILHQWIVDGLNLVSVAKRGHGFNTDIDDIEAAIAKGFDPAWLDGYYLVDTPSRGLHSYPTPISLSATMMMVFPTLAASGKKPSRSCSASSGPKGG
jgi:hypothetical protein